jgi:hypothetical protein
LIYLIIICLGGVVYIAWRVESIEGIVRAITAKAGAEEEAAKRLMPEPKSSVLPDDWTDIPWISKKSIQEERSPFENPNPLQGPDDFNEARILLEIKERKEPADRVTFLKALKGRRTYLNQTVTGAVLRDESALVRAWGARHLTATFEDYTDFNNPVLLADFQEQILADPDPVVRASFWANPDCGRLPWGFMDISEGWKTHFSGLSQMGRLALMGNSDLRPKYVVAVLSAETEELNITRKEHATCLYAAATNPRIVLNSRHTGRDYWLVEGDANPPFSEYGQMWEIVTDKWMDVSFVPYAFLKFVQTRPTVKLAVYQKLMADPENAQCRSYREAIIESCDIFTDKEVLKLAWADPDDRCKEAAVNRVGDHRKIVGVK